MTDYLTPDHPDAFIDFPPVEERRAQFVRLLKREPLGQCPKCHGHGGWNLRLNSNPLRNGIPDTRENRHKFRHFRASCSQCNGWGLVTEQRDLDCVHEAQETRHDNLRCLTDYKCTKCGKTWQVDSSG